MQKKMRMGKLRTNRQIRWYQWQAVSQWSCYTLQFPYTHMMETIKALGATKICLCHNLLFSPKDSMKQDLTLQMTGR